MSDDQVHEMDIDTPAHTAPADTDQFEGGDDGTATEPVEPPPPAGRASRAREMVATNLTQRGTLRVHHHQRDIDVPCDGFHALTVLRHFADRGEDTLLRPVSPLSCPAGNGWTSLSYDGVIGITWLPGVDTLAPTRITFDPR